MDADDLAVECASLRAALRQERERNHVLARRLADNTLRLSLLQSELADARAAACKCRQQDGAAGGEP